MLHKMSKKKTNGGIVTTAGNLDILMVNTHTHTYIYILQKLKSNKAGANPN